MTPTAETVRDTAPAGETPNPGANTVNAGTTGGAPATLRTLTDHIVEGDAANHQLRIEVLDEPGQGGACHLYNVAGYNSASNKSDPFVGRYGAPSDHSTVLFQNGPINEVGVNGVTHEALLAICIDRMRSFQAGPFACEANDRALIHMIGALEALQERTRARILRGVEGTHQE